MKFFIEYEIPPLRAIYWKQVEAEDMGSAELFIKAIHPSVRIRCIRDEPLPIIPSEWKSHPKIKLP